MRILGWQTLCEMKVTKVGAGQTVHNLPASIPREKGLSVSMHVGTRKMVNYA